LHLRRIGAVTKGKKPTKASVEKNICNILSAEHMKDIFDWSILVNEQGKTPDITYMLNHERFLQIQEEKLGRTIIFTDQHEWTNEQIVGTFRSQYHIEEAFKQMKDVKYLSFRPVYHFTDAHIRVHAFYCVLALMLVSLMNK
jgi:transposase